MKWIKVPIREEQLLLLEDNFWETAFKSGIPFSMVNQRNFRTAVVEGYNDVLDVHEEAKYFIRETHLAPIMFRLIQLATFYPDSDFVETLAFFINTEPHRTSLIQSVFDKKNSFLAILENDCLELSKKLIELKDDDLSEKYLQFMALLRRQ